MGDFILKRNEQVKKWLKENKRHIYTKEIKDSNGEVYATVGVCLDKQTLRKQKLKRIVKK